VNPQPQVLEPLASLVTEIQLQWRLTWGGAWHDLDLVVTREDGHWSHPDWNTYAAALRPGLFFLTAAMCKARKWWEHEEGREVDRLWSQAIGDLKVPERRREIPPYALDRHTRRGWELRRAGQHFDDRFSGTDMGRLKTSYLFERDGEGHTRQ
jgi:hypothetical protein